MSEMADWLRTHNAYIPSDAEIPALGYVVYVNARATAMGFIRRVEGGFGQLDGLVSNPTSSSEDRHLAIDLLVSQLLDSAKELGITQIMAFSKDAGTLMRSERHGFKKQLEYSVIAVDLTKRE